MEPMVDSNNNAAVKKYYLRPRNGAKRITEDLGVDEVSKQRSRAKGKTSQRSLTVSKYRRKSANARERVRMREINDAFETLRKVVSWGSDHQGEKATKISTLRLAMQHITALSDALREPSVQTENESQRHRSTGTFGVSERSSPSTEDFPCGGTSEEHLNFRQRLIAPLTDFHCSREPSSCMPSKCEPVIPLNPTESSFTVSELMFCDCRKTFPDLRKPTKSGAQQLDSYDKSTPLTSMTNFPPPSTSSSCMQSKCKTVNPLPTPTSSVTVDVQGDSVSNVHFQGVQSTAHFKSSTNTPLLPPSYPVKFIKDFGLRDSIELHEQIPYITEASISESTSISFVSPSEFEECSPLLSANMESLPFQQISFEELFIT